MPRKNTSRPGIPPRPAPLELLGLTRTVCRTAYRALMHYPPDFDYYHSIAHYPRWSRIVYST